MSIYRTPSPELPDEVPSESGGEEALALETRRGREGQGVDWEAAGGEAGGKDRWKGAMRGLWKRMSNLLDDIVIVLGSENVYLASRELPRPASYAAYVAISRVNGKVIALGDKARALMGREPQNIEVVPLLRQGIPENPALFGDFLVRVVKRHFHSNPLMRPRILVSGNFSTPLMKQVCTEGLLRIKTRDIMFCEPEIAAAVGMGLDILKPDLQSVLVLEKDWMGFMVMSMSGSLTKLRLHLGFRDLLEDILIYFEDAKEFVPRVDELAEQFLTVGFTGAPTLIGWDAWVDQVGRGGAVEVEASAEQFQKAVMPTLLRMRYGVNQALQGLSREQRFTVQAGGTYLAGEYADLPGLRELLGAVFGREFIMPENPHHAMARGLVNLIPNIEMLKAINGAAEVSRVEF